MPKTEREAIEQQTEIYSYLNQRNISTKNITRLEILAASENPRTAECARMVLAVARVKPSRKCRLRVLSEKHQYLLLKLVKTGLIHPDDFYGQNEAFNLHELLEKQEPLPPPENAPQIAPLRPPKKSNSYDIITEYTFLED
jgi:hypothetical protein